MLAGIAGIMTLLFVPAIALQSGITPWFPEEALLNGTMADWIVAISRQKTESLLGIGLFIITLVQFPIVGGVIYRMVQNQPSSHLAFLGVMIQAIGVALALAAFCFSYGFTWALIDIYRSSNDANSLSNLATMGMHGFLVGDDLATTLIAISNMVLSRAAFQAQVLPKWLFYWALVAVILVTVVLLRYFMPVFAFGMIGYPLVLLWYCIVGVIFLRKGGK